MRGLLVQAVAPLYLLACIFLGGSAQGIVQNAVLQLAGIFIIAWAAAAPSGEIMPGPARNFLYLAMAALLIIALQLVPVPPVFWAHGARSRIAADFSIIGISPPWLPISLTPYGSLTELLCLVPPLALYLSIVRLKAYRTSWLVCSLLAGTLTGITLGAIQVAGGDQNSSWYPFSETNLGSAVGFFANANHMATLLVIAVPFVAALAAEVRGRRTQRSASLLVVLAAVALLLVVGIVLNGSFAGFALIVPVIAASSLIIFGPGRLVRWIASAIALPALVGAVVAMATGSLGSGKMDRAAATAVQSREMILATTARAIADYMPFGSGLGSFLRVYRLYESPAVVTNEYVIHAHNDYAELVLELGIPGIVLILLFYIWWCRSVWDVWRKGNGDSFARASTIATAAILAHSIVDFPLRTAAISACFAMSLALLSVRRKLSRPLTGDIRPVRHLVFE